MVRKHCVYDTESSKPVETYFKALCMVVFVIVSCELKNNMFLPIVVWKFYICPLNYVLTILFKYFIHLLLIFHFIGQLRDILNSCNVMYNVFLMIPFSPYISWDIVLTELKCRIIISTWKVETFYLLSPYLFLKTLFNLKFVLCDINIATMTLFWSIYTRFIFSNIFISTFNICIF